MDDPEYAIWVWKRRAWAWESRERERRTLAIRRKRRASDGQLRYHPDSGKRPRKLPIDAGITEPYRPRQKQRGNPPEIWLEASRTACKAAEHVVRERRRKGEGRGRNSSGGEDWTGVLHVAQPVVVLDGMLVSAARDGTGGWVFESIPAAQIEFDFATEKYSRGLYRVDVITVDHLPHYIAVMEMLVQKLHTFNEEQRLQEPIA